MISPQSLLSTLQALRTVSQRHHVGYDYLLRRFWHLYGKRQFSPHEIFRFDLLNPRLEFSALEYYPAREEQLRLDKHLVLSSYLCTTHDKAIFSSICSAAAIPSPKLFAVFDQPTGWDCDGHLLESQADWLEFFQTREEEFIVKPSIGLKGMGITSFRRDETDFVSYEGQRFGAIDLFEFLCRMKEHNLYAGDFAHHSLRLRGESHKTLIQERVFAHPQITELTGSNSLCTCRLFTWLDGPGLDGPAEPQVLSSAFRVVGGDGIIDSFNQGARGNVWCSVDLDSGQIHEAFAKAQGEEYLEQIKSHPATNHNLIGFQIPFWAEAVALAKRLSTVFQPQPLITWDIGITPHGPVAIEGNVGGQCLPSPINQSVPALLETLRRR